MRICSAHKILNLKNKSVAGTRGDAAAAAATQAKYKHYILYMGGEMACVGFGYMVPMHFYGCF